MGAANRRQAESRGTSNPAPRQGMRVYSQPVEAYEAMIAPGPASSGMAMATTATVSFSCASSASSSVWRIRPGAAAQHRQRYPLDHNAATNPEGRQADGGNPSSFSPAIIHRTSVMKTVMAASRALRPSCSGACSPTAVR